jgi:uncharacterized protein YecE (DUF72 family)
MSLQTEVSPEILVGMGGWMLPAFEGTFYPPEAGKGFRKLEYYSRFFDMVEVNATFYTLALRPEQVRRWITDVSANKDFVFTAKLYQAFTHKRTATAEDVKIVHAMFSPLLNAGVMGGLVLQFPHSFVRSKPNEEYLKKLSRTFGSFIMFVELRHDSWNHADVFQFLREHNLHLINVDLPAIKRHMPLTNEVWNGLAYFRLMGRNSRSWDKGGVQERYRYNYSEEELESFVKRIESVQTSAHRTFVVFHNDPNANSAVNGFQLKHLIDQKKPVAVPQSLTKIHPNLSEIPIIQVV